MIWQNVWAWLGLLVLALPLLIHLLARRHARVQPFPTLRFLPASPLLPTRRSRLSDPLLLMVRLAILAAAVAGLAQPLLLTADAQRDTGRALARAIVLDTSASMIRPARGGEAAIQVARRAARRLAGAATTSVILESPAPARSLAGAVGWLALQQGQHEIVVVSDFQIGTIEQPDLLSVPAGIGVLLERVDVLPNGAPLQSVAQHGDAETVARITLGPDRTDMEWTTRPATVRSDSSALLLLTGTAERVAAQAARRAALTIAGASLKPDRAVAIVYPRYDQRAQLLRDARTLNRPWMADALLALRSDSTLQAAAALARERPDATPGDSAYAAALPSVARTADRQTLAFAAQGAVQGRERLLLFVNAEAGSLISVALIAAVTRAQAQRPPVTELEPGTLSPETLAQWQRPAADVSRRQADRAGSASDGRWFWLLALALLALETWLRRTRRPTRSSTLEPGHEHLA